SSVTDAGTFVVAPQASVATSRNFDNALPIGMLGTSIIVGNGVNYVDAFSATDWAARLPEAGQAWAAEIEQAASDAGLDPRLLAAMVWQESRFVPDAVSRSGALGLTQLMPGTADELEVDPLDPGENLQGGARYLAWTIEEFGSIELGLAAYNAGPGTVRRAEGIPDIPETQAYVPKVLDYYRQLGGVA
ncbi:MAG: lytic transglycosylase domain-containing protein, partial [Acidimicrobiia bacterium]|nr:lytic transglycosylase domain-containing protein [Acidimicrobiia bacterium]